ncbi:hypothetical protein Huta_1701 [Halorhabdus utahensis DSM 12940]|uniref:Uncharacterized protein n=1 Tax=Halorhabdus utahensis (strain DSM 12940 / JCM 11049 / AX-2) TaxID=519442 RepID=C7NQX0_HALUD|nr:hypothetical protein [Halorhabdus utahensis]ACV11874.1 hypothetical protein Huta_1701 [Halorhabdus utahensis DSM 12940]
MTESELPDFIERDVLRDISSVTVPDEAILRCFVQANKPFLSKSAVADMTDLSDEAARKRLNSLVNRGVLLYADAGKQTKIYWLNHPESRWPVPDDLASVPSGNTNSRKETVTKINRLATVTIFFGGIFVVFYILDWVSSLEVTDGAFEASINPGVMPALALVLFGVIFYIALQTSLLVENDDIGWPTIRRVYRLLSSRVN